MDGRERINRALRGEEVDRVPCALAFYPVDLEAWAAELPADGEPVDVQFVRFPPTASEDRLRRELYAAGADTRLGNTFQLSSYALWGYRPEAPPRRNPLAGVRSLGELRRFPFPQCDPWSSIEGLNREVLQIHARGMAAGGALPHLGGELFETAWRLRGLAAFLVDLVERPEWADCLLERLCARAVRYAEAVVSAGIDVLGLADDVGMPGTMMISPSMWRRYLRPRLAKIIDASRTLNPELRILYHSDGYYEPIVADLVEIGVDAINPMQPEYMDPVRVRRLAGDSAALWGLVGAQTTFARSTPEAITNQVADILQRLGRRGLVLCPAYDIDGSSARAENVRAFLAAVRALG